jgi:hypothetical protein
MSRASDRLPNSHVESLALCPMTLPSASRTRSWAQVKFTLGPAGRSINADRSTNVRLLKNRDADRAT